jgi:hypothetical protein
MPNEEYMTAADYAELAEIAATVEEMRKRRARVFNRVRQRAYQARKKNGPDL